MQKFRNDLGLVFVDVEQIVAIEPIGEFEDNRPTCRVHLRGGSTVPVYGKSKELHEFITSATGIHFTQKGGTE